MRFYCDAEVAGRLSFDILSLALVSDTGREFYAELSPASDARLDDFARDEVLPQFGRVANATASDAQALANRLTAFLTRFAEPIELMYEQEGVRLLLERTVALGEGGATVLARTTSTDVSARVAGAVFEMAAQRAYSQDPLQRLRPNHALADARALRAKFEALDGFLVRPSATSALEQARSFLSDRGVDHQGRMLGEILAWADSRLESTDDYVHWLFPLPEHSPFNPAAPAPSLGDFAELAKDEAVRAGIARASTRMLRFFGLQFDGVELTKATNWPERSATWVPWATPRDRYLTRMLRSSSLLGFHASATRVMEGLEVLVRHHRGPSAARAVSFWRAAVSGDRLP